MGSQHRLYARRAQAPVIRVASCTDHEQNAWFSISKSVYLYGSAVPMIMVLGLGVLRTTGAPLIN